MNLPTWLLLGRTRSEAAELVLAAVFTVVLLAALWCAWRWLRRY